MTRSLTTLLAIPAVLLAGVAQGSITWLNIPPVDAYYEVGTEFVLEWEPQTRTDTFALTLSSYLTNPIYIGPGSGPFPVPITDSKNIDLFTHDVKYSDGNYTWVIEPVDGRVGPDYWYRFSAYENKYAPYSSPRGFHLQAAS